VRLKDESFNPTGTHKDRMAWEIVVTYRDFLLAKQNGQIDTLPIMSLISA
jgi:cysteine synthase